jgi:nitrogen fixation protein FixH
MAQGTGADAIARSGFVLKGWHVWTMLGVFFGTIIAVNATFITLAMQTFPGEDVKRSYVQGLNYNDTLQARSRQAAIGWQASARFEAGSAENAKPDLVVRMRTKEGAPLRGMQITGALRRAVTDRSDIALTFVETQAGEYRAVVAGLERGGWVLKAQAERGGEPFEFTGRLAW